MTDKQIQSMRDYLDECNRLHAENARLREIHHAAVNLIRHTEYAQHEWAGYVLDERPEYTKLIALLHAEAPEGKVKE